MKRELPNRRSTRLKDFDYSSAGAYFLTVCTKDRRKILSNIVGGDVLGAPQGVKLLPCGEIADRIINQLNAFYGHVQVEQYVIMPNHIHMILLVSENGAPRTSPPTRQHTAVAQFLSTFKRFCNKECGANIWQRYSNDHIIRNREDYEAHLRYIYENPTRWYFDELYTEE